MNRIMEKTQMVLSIDLGRSFEKIEHSLMIKTPSKLGIKETFST